MIIGFSSDDEIWLQTKAAKLRGDECCLYVYWKLSTGEKLFQLDLTYTYKYSDNYLKFLRNLFYNYILIIKVTFNDE